MRKCSYVSRETLTIKMKIGIYNVYDKKGLAVAKD